jgi:hypothetical protein
LNFSEAYALHHEAVTMKINPTSLSLSFIAVSIAFCTAYFAAVAVLTISALNLGGGDTCSNFCALDWNYDLSRFFKILIVKSCYSGAFGWLLATFYNFLTDEVKNLK